MVTFISQIFCNDWNHCAITKSSLLPPLTFVSVKDFGVVLYSKILRHYCNLPFFSFLNFKWLDMISTFSTQKMKILKACFYILSPHDDAWSLIWNSGRKPISVCDAAIKYSTVSQSLPYQFSCWKATFSIQLIYCTCYKR